MADKITSRKEDYSQWYIDLVRSAKLADYADVRGCMVIRPNGYAIWEKMQAALDRMFKETGHVNAYFPLFIPESFIAKEAEHIEGFAPECAVVTHGGGEELAEKLYVRPTSETIIWSSYKKWIQSYRDLPILINQWANVVRWEMRTRLFLRTTEFLWQEGHTAHEAMMQDTKALQSGTSHNLGQNFAKAFDCQFQTKEGKLDYVWATSWGVSTRLIGALIMAHSDDRGLVLPPKLASRQVVIIPILRGDKAAVIARADAIADSLKKSGIPAFVDSSEQNSPGWKFAEYELQGIPIRIELGPRDIENNICIAARRDTLEKTELTLDETLPVTVQEILNSIQQSMFDKALQFRNENTFEVKSYEEFKSAVEKGFVIAHWDGTAETEGKIKEETKATIRVLPEEAEYIARYGIDVPGTCIYSGKAAARKAVFAKAY